VDLLVTLRPEAERPPLGLKWFALEEEVAERLGRPVEMVTERALHPHVRPFIESDRRVLFEDG
jgi:predicted nucleotidyltransferase